MRGVSVSVSRCCHLHAMKTWMEFILLNAVWLNDGVTRRWSVKATTTCDTWTREMAPNHKTYGASGK